MEYAKIAIVFFILGVIFGFIICSLITVAGKVPKENTYKADKAETKQKNQDDEPGKWILCPGCNHKNCDVCRLQGRYFGFCGK